LKIAQKKSFTPVQLSPTAPLGSCSIVATAVHYKIISLPVIVSIRYKYYLVLEEDISIPKVSSIILEHKIEE
jgi:hypothetical protein